ncbi:MAG: hypothetical protein ACW99G_01765 [Candidatus Thorarchaeota archaeon]|jgi:hypothetical protein
MNRKRRKPRVLKPGEKVSDEDLVLEQNTGLFNLINLDGGYIGVADRGTKSITGYVVPKNVAALYYRFWSIAVAVQTKHGLKDPTREEMLEIMKRYLNKLADTHEDALHDAILEVLPEDVEWKPEEEWNIDAPSKFIPDEDLPFQPGKIYDEEENIGTGSSGEGTDELP